MTTAHPETHSFQAEVNEVLAIVVNSLYSHKEVFLRELISNASDALDRLAFQALTQHELLGDDRELRIELMPSKTARTLTIRDNGIGMTKEELIANLGTIARSGSKQWLRGLADAARNDVSLIGQFGVGFYSAYLVADRVTVVSRAAGAATAWQWESDAKSQFTLTESEKETRGTSVILHLKEGETEFLDEWRLRELVRKYSDYVRYPIRSLVERETEGKTESEWQTINAASALWARPKGEVTREQYDEFYKHVAHDWEAPLAHVHFKVEGAQELTGLLFIPSRPPLDLFERKPRGVRLYVKRVFIMDDCAELLPDWLRFVRGVVDSQDLPLNVSRELLQQDRATRLIQHQIVQKTLGLLEELAQEGETTQPGADGKPETVDRYRKFWEAFGRILKEGVHVAPQYRERIAKLLRWRSSASDGLVALADYRARMQAGQPGIYWISGDSLATCRSSPHLEALTQRGYEVLFMTDPVDEWVVTALGEFDGQRLISAAKGGLELPEAEGAKQKREQTTAELQDLLQKMQAALPAVKEVRVTDRLTESPACLVTEEGGLSPHLERILRANGQDVPEQKRVLELNPQHPIVQKLRRLAAEPRDDEPFEDWSRLLYDQALLAEGTLPEDPARLARALGKLMSR